MGRHALDSTPQGRYFYVLYNVWVCSIFAWLAIIVIGWTTPIDVEKGAWEVASNLLLVPFAIGGVGSAISYIRWETAHERRLVQNAASSGKPDTERKVSTARVTARYFGDAIGGQIFFFFPVCIIFFGLFYFLRPPLGDIAGPLLAAGAALAWIWSPVPSWLIEKWLDREKRKASTTARI